MFRYNTLQTNTVDVQKGSYLTTTLPNENLLELFTAVTGNTFRSKKLSPQKKETADVFHAAISLHGLPMAVILDSRGRTPFTNTGIQESACMIMGLLEKLSLELHGTQLPDKVLHTLIKERYRTLNDAAYGHAGDAAFSAMVTFKNHQGQLKTLSFGMGDTMLTMVHPDKTETIIAARCIKEVGSSQGYRPLYFPSPKGETVATQEKTLNNLEIDIQAVEPSNRFIFLTDGAYDYISHIRIGSEEEKVDVLRAMLQHDAIPPNSSIFTLAERANQQAADDFKNHRDPCGGDITIAELYIPTKQQQCYLQNIFYLQAKEALERTLAASTLPEPIRQKFNPVKEKIDQLKNSRSPDLPALTKALIKTNWVIENRNNQTIVDDYLTYAATEISQRNSFLWKALGIAMALAGMTLALIGGLSLAGTLGLSHPLSGGLIAGGIILVGTGATFFAQGYRKDLQKTMVNASSVLQQSSRP